MFQSEKPCEHCGRNLKIQLDDFVMCVGCNFRSASKSYKSFTFKGWVFVDLGENGIEIVEKGLDVNYIIRNAIA